MYCRDCWTENTKLVETPKEGCVLCGCPVSLTKTDISSYISLRKKEIHDELEGLADNVSALEKEFVLLSKAYIRL